MPLTQGRIVGYDNERPAFRFTMLNGDETVNCQISDAYHVLLATLVIAWNWRLGH